LIFHVYKFRYFKDTNNVLLVAETKDELRLLTRPYPLFGFVDKKLRSTPLLYATRICSIVPPLICVILICANVSKLKDYGSLHWLWKFALASHCTHILYNISTMSSPERFLMIGIIAFHCILIIPLIAVLTTSDVSDLEWSVVLYPYFSCMIFIIVGGWIFVGLLRVLWYRHWLSTFDRHWRPEKTRWWWRPLGIRQLFKGVKGHNPG